MKQQVGRRMGKVWYYLVYLVLSLQTQTYFWLSLV